MQDILTIRHLVLQTLKQTKNNNMSALIKPRTLSELLYSMQTEGLIRESRGSLWPVSPVGRLEYVIQADSR